LHKGRLHRQVRLTDQISSERPTVAVFLIASTALSGT
jgi:hypothetical protein